MNIDPGLCALCQHTRAIASAKGSVFWLCRKSESDPRYRKYPPIPVRACPGFVRRPEGQAVKPEPDS